ncbi:RNA 2',3'-cyclic phosphodiesterase [Magnetofaba australis]|uniref:RNA 2',3'-cyclic phosphodiesterase n=1 Tax=Magnetofaba australis IT-1 TaxID=1434232 RepID=A0A1Y2K9L7_9PROT|nr:RNA 2',3'-cyclic phosphodiesterase [Magnetofaba australis]OSM07313.1 putative 2'-5' RNA ligase [Magnetofaba australis IT-1]
MTTQRLFISLEPPEAIKQAIGHSLSALKQVKGVRWAHPAQYHLTLRFLGDTPDADIDGLSTSLGEIALATPEFTLQLTQWGAFPDAQQGRIFWAGVTDTNENLAKLAQQIAALEPTQEPQSAFTPHITVARRRNTMPLTALLGQTPLPPLTWRAQSIQLMASTLTDYGAQHHVIARHTLAASPPTIPTSRLQS